MKVICISGKAQHGKDTSAQFLQQKLESEGHSVLLTHYGDLLKYICRSFFNWNGEKDEYGRTLLQSVGTDGIRAHEPDYLVRFIADMLTFFPGHWDYVLLPDCRMPGELEVLRERGLDVMHVRVIRSPFQSPLTAEQQAHITETALDEYPTDYIIANSGTLEELRAKLDSFADNILLERKSPLKDQIKQASEKHKSNHSEHIFQAPER